MNRLALAGFLSFSLAAAAQAQDAPAPAADISKQLIGTWEGPYQSEAVPPGSLKLVVAREANKEWKVSLAIISDQPPAAGELRDFAVEGNSVSWVQDIDEMTCRSVAKLVAGLLKGDAECSQGGAVVLTATFLLEKKA
jgi:hypothetical protein